MLCDWAPVRWHQARFSILESEYLKCFVPNLISCGISDSLTCCKQLTNCTLFWSNQYPLHCVTDKWGKVDTWHCHCPHWRKNRSSNVCHIVFILPNEEQILENFTKGRNTMKWKGKELSSMYEEPSGLNAFWMVLYCTSCKSLSLQNL